MLELKTDYGVAQVISFHYECNSYLVGNQNWHQDNFFHFHCLFDWSGTNLYFDGYRSCHMWKSKLNGTIYLISIGNIIVLIDWCSEHLLIWLTFEFGSELEGSQNRGVC